MKLIPCELVRAVGGKWSKGWHRQDRGRERWREREGVGERERELADECGVKGRRKEVGSEREESKIRNSKNSSPSPSPLSPYHYLRVSISMYHFFCNLPPYLSLFRS